MAWKVTTAFKAIQNYTFNQGREVERCSRPRDVSLGMSTRLALGRKDSQARITAVYRWCATLIADNLDRVNDCLEVLNTTVDKRLASVTGPAGKALNDLFRHILANTSETSDLFLDCRLNQNCLGNQLIPALRTHRGASEKIAYRIVFVAPKPLSP
jgi:hypothetical protein